METLLVEREGSPSLDKEVGRSLADSDTLGRVGDMIQAPFIGILLQPQTRRSKAQACEAASWSVRCHRSSSGTSGASSHTADGRSVMSWQRGRGAIQSLSPCCWQGYDERSADTNLWVPLGPIERVLFARNR